MEVNEGKRVFYSTTALFYANPPQSHHPFEFSILSSFLLLSLLFLQTDFTNSLKPFLSPAFNHSTTDANSKNKRVSKKQRQFPKRFGIKNRTKATRGIIFTYHVNIVMQTKDVKATRTQNYKKYVQRVIRGQYKSRWV